VTDPTDRALLERVIASGDEAAFRDLYRRHTPALYRVAVRLTEDRDGSAEDLVHDTWLRASDRWSEFAWRSSLRTWLTGILLNRIREARRAWDRAGGEAFAEPAQEPAPLDLGLDLADALARLPAGYRAAVVLHDVEGYQHDEIADLLGIEIGTSKSQLSRARRALRGWLAPDWSES